MDRLRALFADLGFTDVETFIASGNVLFGSRAKAGAPMEKKIEAALHQALGYEVKAFLRTGAEVAAIAAYRPFQEAQINRAEAFNVGFLAEPLGPAGIKTVSGFKTALDDFRVHGRELYWLSRTRQSESTFSNALFEKTLKTRATFRGMNTVVRLVARYGLSAR